MQKGSKLYSERPPILREKNDLAWYTHARKNRSSDGSFSYGYDYFRDYDGFSLGRTGTLNHERHYHNHSNPKVVIEIKAFTVVLDLN